MHRIDTATAQQDKFGQGKNGFTNGDPATGRRATDLNSDMWDAVQEEICGVIESAGIQLAKTQHNQLYLAIKAIIKGDLPDALIRKNNLSDVPDKAFARNALELGTAATFAAQTSKTDSAANRLMVVGAFGLGGAETSLPDGTNIYKFFATAKSGNYGGGGNLPGALTSGWRSFKWQQHGSDNKYGMLLEFGSDGRTALHVYNNPDGNMTSPENYWYNKGLLYGEKYKPTASDIGAVPTSRTVNGHALTANVNVTSQDIFNTQSINIGASQNLDNYQTPGIYCQAANANTSAALNYPENLAGTLLVLKNAGVTQVYYVYNSSRIWTRSKYSTGAWTAWAREYNTLNKPSAADVGALPSGGGTLNGNLTVKNMIQVGGVGNGILNIGDNDSGLRSSIDGQVDLWSNNQKVGYWKSGTFSFTGQFVPTNYANFDAKYQAKGNYTPAGQAYTKSESDSRYQLKNSASKAANGWHKDATTGIITQWGYVKKAGDRNAYITFPIAFPSAICSVVINIDGSPGWSPNLVQFVYNVSRTGCSVSAHDPDKNRGVYWMAIGY